MPSVSYEIKLTYLIAALILLLFIIFIISIILVYKRKQTIFQLEKTTQEEINKNILLSKELEKQVALNEERHRISADMHDDLGSGLSSIKLISEMLKQKHNDSDTQNDLNEIVLETTELTNTIREMVWCLNPKNDTLDSFIDYLDIYTKHFFMPSGIALTYQTSDTIPHIELSGYIRRNLLLTLKEIYNNIIKHSRATKVTVDVKNDITSLHISVADNGIGINEQTKSNNGLDSIKKRIQNCNGTTLFETKTPGLQINIQIPLNG